MPISVLILDDNETTGGVLKELLERYKIDVTFVTNLAAGIAANRLQPRNFVTLDLELPDSPDVMETLKRVKEFLPSKVVIITGQDDPEVLAELGRTGQAYILKADPGKGMFAQLMKYMGLTNEKDLPIQP